MRLHRGWLRDETCHKCHFENDLNDPVGSLGLDGVPENYVSTASWSVRWTAPEDAAGMVRFNLAGNASNYDASEFGDFVYTEEALSRPPRLVRHHDLR